MFRIDLLLFQQETLDTMASRSSIFRGIATVYIFTFLSCKQGDVCVPAQSLGTEGIHFHVNKATSGLQAGLLTSMQLALGIIA